MCFFITIKQFSEYMDLFHYSHYNFFLFSNSICIVCSVNYFDNLL